MLGSRSINHPSKVKTFFNLTPKQLASVGGVVFLVASLIIGLVFFSQGTGVFAPRAAPETTPKEVQISNVSDKGFTVSFFTTEKTPGFIKYGDEPNKLQVQIGDERDQLSGEVGNYQLHYITVGGLNPDTTYYFTLGTGTKTNFDNNGKPFEVKTAKKATTPPAAKTIYGNVITSAGTPPKEAVVYAKAEGAGLLSSLVKKSGSWAIPLSQARTVDGSSYANLTEESILVLMALAPPTLKPTTINTTVGEFQSGETITLGQQPQATAGSPSLTPKQSPKPTTSPSVSLSPSISLTPSPSLTLSPTLSITPRAGGLSQLLESSSSTTASTSASASAINKIVDLTNNTEQQPVVQTTQPKIIGKAKPKVKVKISIHSDNQIETEVTTDDNGQFSVDIEALKQTLEPGEHTIEYTYIDPDTGEEVTKVETFVVEDPNTATQIAQAEPTPTLSYATTETTATNSYNSDQENDNNQTPTTYGTDYPYSSESTASAGLTPSPNPSPSLTSTATTTASVSSLPKAGAVDATLAMIGGGLFFILAGVWSFWISIELKNK